MEKSSSITNIAKALVQFQNSLAKILKDSDNPFFKSKYASLSNIQDAIKTPLYEAGLALSQFPEGQAGLTTILIHGESGEFLQATYDMPPTKNDPQGHGSAITYQRRYAIASVLGLNIDDDDDGNAASKPADKKQTSTAAPATNGTPVDNRKWLNKNTQEWTDCVKFLADGGSIPRLEARFKISKADKDLLMDQAMQPA